MYMNEVCEMPYCKNIDIDEQIEFIGNLPSFIPKENCIYRQVAIRKKQRRAKC